ncbi:MAG: AsnC family transcriptional regulator [Candidatus Marsarchaeota archaeon]|nr:AsnC family transcriptional regulator [Candidatus Marsarchaeota archaeon]
MDAPEAVMNEYRRLRALYPFFISLKKISGRYYVYKQLTRTNPSTKKVKIITTYLGRISETGKFMERGALEDFEMENAIKLIEAKGGKVTLPQEPQKHIQPETSIVDETDKKILMALSMNSRIKYSKLGAIVGLSEKKAETRVKRLERLLDIRYITEIDIHKLGYQSFMVFARFVGEKPSKRAVEAAVANEPRVQLAMLTRGIYDLVIYLLAEDDNALSDAIANIRSDANISAYKSDWYATPLYETYGYYIPIMDRFFDVLKEKVWKRTKESLRPKEGQLYSRDYTVLREVTNNGIAKFSDIDKEHGFDDGAAKYSYHARLEGPGIVRRPTITMVNSGVKYNAIIIMGIEVRKGFIETKKELLHYEIEETNKVTNKLLYLADIKVPNGVLFIMPVYDDGGLEDEEEKLESKVKGIGVNSLVVTDILVGQLCYRKFDNMYTKSYESLIRSHKVNLPQNRILYD